MTVQGIPLPNWRDSLNGTRIAAITEQGIKRISTGKDAEAQSAIEEEPMSKDGSFAPQGASAFRADQKPLPSGGGAVTDIGFRLKAAVQQMLRGKNDQLAI